jgi:hypothetical protein
MRYSIIILFLITLFAVSGCKYFKKPPRENVSLISADTLNRQAEADSVLYPVPTPATSPAGAITKGNYYMIVGCFTVSQNAESYASGLRQKGYNAMIIPGRDNFSMVAVQSYSDYLSSIADIEKYRTEITPGAWVHLSK